MSTDKIKEAEKAAKEFLENLSPEEFEQLKNKFKEAYSRQLIDAEEKLNSLVLEKEQLEKDKMQNYEAERATQDYAEKSKLSNARMEMRKVIDGLTVLIIHQKNIVKALKNGGSVSSIDDLKETTHEDISNFTKVDTSKFAFDVDTILDEEVPPYIPEINERVFRGKGYVFDAIRIAKDTYLMAVNGYNEKINTTFSYKTMQEEGGVHPTDAQQGYVLVTLDQLVLINDYYFKRAKAILQRESDEKNKRAEETFKKLPEERKLYYYNHKNFYDGIPAAVKKKISKEDWEKLTLEEKQNYYIPVKRYGVERIKSKLEENQMWVSFADLYRRFINPKALPPKKGYEGKEIFDYWYEFRDMMKFKIKDIQIQREQQSEVRKIALETSFGESNTDSTLKDKYGILVKRQDGSKINPNEIEQIREAWELVSKTFGDLKQYAIQDNLKISHTGKKYVFASKAAGMYVPNMKTIAVSEKFGESQFKSTLAHECAHWIDHQLGVLSGKRHATDNFEDTAGVIAREFRKNMNQPSDSDYVNATAECFARAMEQYFAMTNFGDDATLIFSNVDLGTIRTYIHEDSYVNKNVFYGIIKPLIEKFIEENSDFLNIKIPQVKEEIIVNKNIQISVQNTLNFVANMETLQEKVDKLKRAINSAATPEPQKALMNKTLSRLMIELDAEQKSIETAKKITSEILSKFDLEKYFSLKKAGGTAEFKIDSISPSKEQIKIFVEGISPIMDSDDEKFLKKESTKISELNPVKINVDGIDYSIEITSTVPQISGNDVTANITLNLNKQIK